MILRIKVIWKWSRRMQEYTNLSAYEAPKLHKLGAYKIMLFVYTGVLAFRIVGEATWSSEFKIYLFVRIIPFLH